MKKRAVFFINYNSYFENLTGVAQALEEVGGYDCVGVFPLPYETRKAHADAWLAAGREAVDARNNLIRAKDGAAQKVQPLASGKPAGGGKTRGPMREWVSFVRALRQARQETGKFLRLLEELQADVVILGGDIVGTETNHIVKAAGILGIPSVAFVNWIGEFEGASAYRANQEHQVRGFFGWAVKTFFPRWIHWIDAQPICRLPPWKVVVWEMLRLAPPKPWVLHSGGLDAIGVEGESMRQGALRQGLPAGKLFATGASFHDELHSVLSNKASEREELYRELGLSAEKPMLLVAIPPDFLYPVAGVPQCPQCDFQDYQLMVRYWLSCLTAQTRYHVVASLHPATKSTDLPFIEEYGVRVCRRKTSLTIPLADVYVACVSATIGIAIAAGVPVINYDVYRFHYRDYLDYEAVLLAHEQGEFESHIRRLATDEDFYRWAKTQQLADGRRYSLIDGQASERITGLVEHALRLKG